MKKIFPIFKSILSVVTIPLWFIRMFVGVGHLPDQTTGEIVEVIFRHSMLENVGDLTHPVLAYISIAISLISAVVNAIVLKFPGNKKLRICSDIAFGTAIGLFLIFLLLAFTVRRGY